MKAGAVFAVLSLFVALAGCAKYSVECELVLQPRVMISSGSAIDTPAYMARAYVYYIEQNDIRDSNWRPESYADADAGLVRHRTTGEVRSHGLTGTQSPEDSYIHIVVSKSPVLLVAVDPINRFYAYRTFEYQVPLERILIPVSFKIWQKESRKEEGWTIIGEASENTQGE